MKKILSTKETAIILGVCPQRVRARLIQDQINKKRGGFVYFPNARKLGRDWAVLAEDLQDLLINRTIEELFPPLPEDFIDMKKYVNG